MSLFGIKRSRAGWWLVGVALLGTFAFVLYSFIGTFVFGVFIYYATRSIYRRIERVIGPPSLAAAVSLFALALPALALVTYALAIVVREIERFTADQTFDLTQYPGIDQDLLARIADPTALLTLDLAEYVSADTAGRVLRSLGSAADTLAFLGIGAVHLFVMFALAFYLLRDDDRLRAFVADNFADDDGVLEEFLGAVDRDFHSIFFGNILNAILTGTIGVLTYTLLNVVAPPGLRIPTPALVGLLAGVASLIPVVGMKLVYVPVVVYMGLLAVLMNPAALWFVAAFAAVSFVVVDTIPDLVLRPYVSGRSLHVGTVMIAYTLGPLLFGWYGIFLLPMLLVLFDNFARRVLKELVKGRTIQSHVVDTAYLARDEHGEVIGVGGHLPADGGGPGGASTAGNPSGTDASSKPGERSRSGDRTDAGGGGDDPGPRTSDTDEPGDVGGNSRGSEPGDEDPASGIDGPEDGDAGTDEGSGTRSGDGDDGGDADRPE